MVNLGDVTKIDGNTAPIVDVVCGGSPCQDLSVAGFRKGLKHEDLGDDETTRSGLFMEQIRIIKEMRAHDRQSGRTGIFIRPRWGIWENVPGALSSNSGDDFRCVLESFAKIADENSVIPRPPKDKWQNAGCIMGDGWSIAWRIFDAQFWGVPQRRKRIALVADFAGQCAAEVLFERKSLSGNFEPGIQKRKTVAGDSAEGSGTASAVPYTLQVRTGCEGGGKDALIQTDKSATISAFQTQTLMEPVTFAMQAIGEYKASSSSALKMRDYKAATDLICEPVCYGISPYASNCMKSGNPHSGIYEADTARTLDLNCCDPGCNQGGIAVCEPFAFHKETGQELPAIVEPIMVEMTSTKNTVVTDGISPTLTARMGTGGNQVNIVCDNVDYIARRLTPLECTRLQGFPDHWLDIGDWVDSNGKAHKGDADAPKYKAIGNSISIPNWKWVLKRISAQYERNATLASLFDGIGGFPYIWEQFNGKGSAVWSSEIEEFPMAVTRYHFGGEA